MRFLGTLLLFAGYTLIYAAIADHGKFATEPWAGLLDDAYGGDTPASTGASTVAGAATTAPQGVDTIGSPSVPPVRPRGPAMPPHVTAPRLPHFTASGGLAGVTGSTHAPGPATGGGGGGILGSVVTALGDAWSSVFG